MRTPLIEDVPKLYPVVTSLLEPATLEAAANTATYLAMSERMAIDARVDGLIAAETSKGLKG